MTQFLHLAFRDVFRNRRRTLMTMLIVAVGVCALVLSGGFFVYMFHELAEGTIRFGIGHLQIVNAAALGSSEKHVLEHGLENYQQILASSRRVPHVMGAAPRISFFGMTSNGGRSDTFMAMAVDPEAERPRSWIRHDSSGFTVPFCSTWTGSKNWCRCLPAA